MASYKNWVLAFSRVFYQEAANNQSWFQEQFKIQENIAMLEPKFAL